MRVVMEEIANWQQGRFDANPHFQASLSTDPEPRVTLVPREASWGKMIRRIELTLSREQAGVMKNVRLVEDERSFTDLNFSQVRTNRPLPGFPVCERGMNATHGCAARPATLFAEPLRSANALTALYTNTILRRLVPLLLLLLTVNACTGLKPLIPLDPARKNAVLENCRRPFLPGSYRLFTRWKGSCPTARRGRRSGFCRPIPGRRVSGRR